MDAPGALDERLLPNPHAPVYPLPRLKLRVGSALNQKPASTTWFWTICFWPNAADPGGGIRCGPPRRPIRMTASCCSEAKSRRVCRQLTWPGCFRGPTGRWADGSAPAAQRTGGAAHFPARGYLRGGISRRAPLISTALMRWRMKPCPTGPAERCVILGSGPNRIGQGIEFDYCCLPGGLRPGRTGLRDHHGQLQPGNRLHRLRHLRPPVFRAHDPRARAQRHRTRKTALA